MPRLPLPSDLASLRVPTDVRLSPDGRPACFVVKEASPDQAGYRMALWLVPADGSAPPRRLTLGARRDVAPRWSPDGRWLAFLSDRGAVLRAGGAPRDAEDRGVPARLRLVSRTSSAGTSLAATPRSGCCPWTVARPGSSRTCPRTSATWPGARTATGSASSPVPPAAKPAALAAASAQRRLSRHAATSDSSTSWTTSSTASASPTSTRRACGSWTSPQGTLGASPRGRAATSSRPGARTARASPSSPTAGRARTSPGARTSTSWRPTAAPPPA